MGEVNVEPCTIKEEPPSVLPRLKPRMEPCLDPRLPPLERHLERNTFDDVRPGMLLLILLLLGLLNLSISGHSWTGLIHCIFVEMLPLFILYSMVVALERRTLLHHKEATLGPGLSQATSGALLGLAPGAVGPSARTEHF